MGKQVLAQTVLTQMKSGIMQKLFAYFPYISLCKTCDPKGGDIFGHEIIIKTNLVKVY